MKLLTREEAPIGGRDPSESPAGFDRNAWPPSLGIHGRLRRNAQFSSVTFLCSTAPQAFLRPDRGSPRPSRADAVKVGRHAIACRRHKRLQAELDGGEHGGILDPLGVAMARPKSLTPAAQFETGAFRALSRRC